MSQFDNHFILKDDYFQGTLIYGWVSIDVWNGIESVTYGNPLFHMHFFRTSNADVTEFTLYEADTGDLINFISFEGMFNLAFAAYTMNSLVENWATHESE
jgi:hypothetical protein